MRKHESRRTDDQAGDRHKGDSVLDRIGECRNDSTCSLCDFGTDAGLETFAPTSPNAVISLTSAGEPRDRTRAFLGRSAPRVGTAVARAPSYPQGKEMSHGRKRNNLQTVLPRHQVGNRGELPRMSTPVLTLLVVLAIARSVCAQTPPDVPAPTVAERRACEGCPDRSVGKAFAQTTIVNGLYELANLARGQVTAKITPATWWANMQQGWVWDLDDFVVNQIGHPYQGNNYFNTGRANGLSFWESAGITAFGSGTWEYFGETNHASLNDLINTTLGGIALGEMFHRTAWLVRDTRATGRSRRMREIAATAIDPITGVNRFLSGDASRLSEKPAELVPTRLGGHTSAGVLWRGSNTGALESSGEPFVEMDLLYGDPTIGRSRTPYDAFAVRLRLGGGAGISEARVRGRLLGQPFRGEGFQLTVLQAYDFAQNSAYQFGAQSFEMNAAFTGKISSRTSAWVSGWGGLTALGAVDSLPPTGPPPVEEPPPDGESAGQGVSEGPRFYDYGPGANFGAGANLRRDGRTFAAIFYESHHLYSLDGVRANHLLQQLRLDLLAPLRGPLGIGVSGEYFHRKTYYKDGTPSAKLHFPQFRAYLTWRVGS
jgi:Domain of unknown function (DUF3943)